MGPVSHRRLRNCNEGGAGALSAKLTVNILVLEFSSVVRSVALLSGPSVPGPLEVLSTASEEMANSARPLRLVERALEQAALSRDQIGTIAVGLGPGSYTGIRSAIALAQGWQLALEVGVAGLSTIEGLAVLAQAKGWLGRVGFVIDAQRDEFYFAGFEISAETLRCDDALRIVPRTEAASLESRYPIIAGPDAMKFFVKGRSLQPEAPAYTTLVAKGVELVPAEKLEPIYLREASFVKAAPARMLPGL